MACNRDVSADGRSTSPTGTPSACPKPDVLVPCCNDNCCLSGCTSPPSESICPKCRAERVKEGGIPHTVSVQTVDLPVEPAGAPVMADITDLHGVLKSKRPPSRHTRGRISTLPSVSGTASSSSTDLDLQMPYPSEGRMPSPLSLSPPEFESENGLTTTAPQPRQQAVNRCLACRKRLGLLGFKCRCGDLFCALHRYSDKHDCSFDYKAAGRLAIAKENPVVKAIKIDRI